MTTETEDRRLATDATAKARAAISALLDGQSPNGVTPDALGGVYAQCYSEMLRAWEQGKTEAARRVFVSYADNSAEIAALRAGDAEPGKRLWTAAEILRAEFPEPKWIVHGLLPTGLISLGGRPKLGKSWKSLQIAVAVGTGGKFLGRDVERGKVLYLALEDSPRRIQDRLRKQQVTGTPTIDFHFEWQPLAGQGTVDLFSAVDSGGYSLVIVDTLSRALGRADQMDLGAMGVAIGSLQRLAIDREICLLLIDHHRKSASSGEGDPIDDLMGSTGKSAPVDVALGLYRKRGDRNAILKVTGRDVEEQELAVNFDRELFCWQLVGDAGAVRTDTVQAGILEALDELGGESTAAKIAQWLGRDRSNVRKELLELMHKNAVIRTGKEGREVKYKRVKPSDSSE